MKAALVLLMLPLGVVMFLIFASVPHTSSTPHPAPFSCSALLASIAPVDGGGTIAPLCGQAQEATP